MVAGASGRMGRALVREISQGQGMKLVGALEAEGNPDLETFAGCRSRLTVTMKAISLITVVLRRAK